MFPNNTQILESPIIIYALTRDLYSAALYLATYFCGLWAHVHLTLPQGVSSMDTIGKNKKSTKLNQGLLAVPTGKSRSGIPEGEWLCRTTA